MIARSYSDKTLPKSMEWTIELHYFVLKVRSAVSMPMNVLKVYRLWDVRIDFTKYSLLQVLEVK